MVMKKIKILVDNLQNVKTAKFPFWAVQPVAENIFGPYSQQVFFAARFNRLVRTSNLD